ncbi:serine hydrolase domain-containing protein [Muriicola sp. Z0-33]|uniref:serine hydrolase domain-containing protein n=1 Tax=Muriicola sp. Z0-33 TaxID=2816957 RepID=UPI0022384049|nr:serine hydrolase domain-containing protein [Muriicola sp. Z0-33]MCW5518158.1 beta-lactamase family protein [Muriicola sp. Z0-33]
MNYRIASFIIPLILFFGCTKHQKKEESFQAIIESSFKEHPDAIGIMVHVEAPKQGISWSGAVGYSNWDKTDTIEADQPALIASITKNYVAVSILRLIEQEKLDLFQSIDKLLSERTSTLMKQYGFELEPIKVAHLLAHKSGIPGHTRSKEFQEKVKTEPMYRWTRDEQINLAITQGPRNPPGTRFYYTDTNYLLLTEILEQVTGKEYYDAIKDLVGYKKFGLNSTWFYSLEAIPDNTKTLIHQYVPENNEDSYAIDNSFDLFGGGGIAATTRDLGKYAYNVFQGNVFDNQKTVELMLTDIKTSEGDPHEDYIGEIPCEYYLGIQECGFDGLNSYWHAGYWGTIFRYFPDLEASVVLYVVNESEFAYIELDLMKQITELLK